MHEGAERGKNIRCQRKRLTADSGVIWPVSRVLFKDSHLSWRSVAAALQPPEREQPGRPYVPIAVLLRIEFTGLRAFTRQPVSSYLAFPPLPQYSLMHYHASV